ncbi:DNA glycosylase AlkZ-like family protein [Nesterenkonia muleiensis]|uniref:DNA glycosylase AlkZ-like family protein n=1 Tax=Nesterenkonia muleiensis TaxID=2282648 RepID=UPI0013007F9F|nr:crosslink repair DNA glycosylase YcaQ family protein [Nesterenkonia muleiensis]
MTEHATVSPEWVRGAVVAAQKIPAPGVPGEYGDAADVLRGIGLIQLDPLTRVSTAQRLTCLTRLPRKHRAAQVDAALWPGETPVAFEAFTKVACLFPLQDWPLMELRRRAFREQVRQRYADTFTPKLREQISEVVAAQPRGVQIGTIESALGSARTTGWNWSQVKQAAEFMVRTGELVITARDGIVRLFDLPERALPAGIREAEHLPPDQLRADLARRAAGSLAVMTVNDFAHHYHLSKHDAAHGIELAGLVPVVVPGWRDMAYVLPELLEADVLGGDGIGPVKEARLIGPFDPLLRDRRRALRIFGFDYTFEAYVPKAKRIYGHYVMGVLSGTELIGRVDLWRSDGELVINRIFPEPGIAARSVTARAKAAAATLSRQLGITLRLPAS